MNSVNKNIVQNQTDTRWANLIAEIREENRESYKKIENRNQIEMNKLKISLSELKQDLQNKNHQLKTAFEQINQLKKRAMK